MPYSAVDWVNSYIQKNHHPLLWLLSDEVFFALSDQIGRELLTIVLAMNPLPKDRKLECMNYGTNTEQFTKPNSFASNGRLRWLWLS